VTSAQEEIRRVALIRHNAHSTPGHAYGPDPLLLHEIGVAGEEEFAKVMGLSMDKRGLPRGDGGRDFEVQMPAGLLTIDVKTYQKPGHILIKEWDIERCADILVLCGWKPGNVVTLIGWDTFYAIERSPVKDFGYGRNFARHAKYLRPIVDLREILSHRIDL
jgi:hypothetical protein